MTGTEAIECAQADFELVMAGARNALMALMSDPRSIGGRPERYLLVDGSMYSPSWRALRGGAAVYEHENGSGDLAEIYTEELDRLTDAWAGPDGQYLYWEEGMLFLSNEPPDDAA